MKSWPSIFLDAQAESSQPLIGFGGGLDCQHGNPCGYVGLSDCEVFGVLWEVKQGRQVCGVRDFGGKHLGKTNSGLNCGVK
ncbi:hypothetical protein Tco_1035635, partial [Tanacetum coccineum]